MPGASLWLLPPHAHTLNQDLQSLIQQTSAHFGSSDLFIPHVTLTSGIPPQAYSSDPQAWLDSLHFSTASQVQVLFERLDSEDVFVRKLYIKCAKTDGLKQLAKVCRQQVPDCAQKAEAETWVNDTYNPHTSLLYHDCPRANRKQLTYVEKLVQRTGIRLSDPESKNGWVGGVVALVQTDNPIHTWVPIATRVL